MTEHSSSLDKRLQLIDQYLMFRGQVGRANLISHFDIGIATASRSLKEYRKLFPDNIAYSVSERLYTSTPQFQPKFKHDVNQALSLIAYGLEIRQIRGACFGQLNPLPFSAPMNASVVSLVTKAMVKRETIKIAYASGSSGDTTRVLQPHTLFQGGSAWYVRAFDTHKNEFRTFRLSRIKSAEKSLKRGNDWSAEFDNEWLQSVNLTLAPHPKRSNQEALREDLGLSDKPVRNIQVNAVTAGFALIDLRVDCSKDGSLNPYEYHLRLMNRHELLGVSSLAISPGFNSKD